MRESIFNEGSMNNGQGNGQRVGVGFVVLRTDDPRLVRHDSREAATAEANRLAIETGGTFVVLQPTTVVMPMPKTIAFDVVI